VEKVMLRMFALMRLAEGLVIAHGVLLAAFLAGSSVFPPAKNSPVSPGQSMLRFVCTCAAGFALCGGAFFFLALLGLLSAPFLIAAFAAIVLAASLARHESVLASEFWRIRLRALAAPWDFPALLLYGLILIVAVPAVLPNISGDPINYQLAYPEEWARAGRLVIDPFLRFPVYASNFNLFFAALFVFHGEAFVNFVTWATVFLTACGICASIRVALDSTPVWGSIVGIALTLAVVLSPPYLRWVPTAYIDIPIGAFALMPVLCIQLALRERRLQWLTNAALLAGFLLGMKGSFLLLLPLFALALFLALRAVEGTRRQRFGILLLLFVCAAPWYLRNVALAGDPAPPVLNLAFYGSDGFLTQSEWDAYASDLATTRTPAGLVSIPFRAFLDAGSRDFREYGVTALIFLLYFPTAIRMIRFSLHTRDDPAAVLSVLVLTGYVVYWEATSTLLRYSSLFYPLLAVCVAWVFAPLVSSLALKPKLGRFAWPGAALAAIALVVPSPGTKPFYMNLYYNDYKYLPASYTNDEDYMRRFGAGYVDAEFAADAVMRKGVTGRVYVLGGDHFYYFRRHGIISVGDWGGPAGFFRLAAAIDAHQALPFLSSLGVNAVLIETVGGKPGGLGIPLERQLRAGGFCELRVPGTQSRLLLRNSCAGQRSRTFTSSS
jgi:hypothetical protein